MNFRSKLLILIIAGSVLRIIAVFNLPLTFDETHQIILSRSDNFIAAAKTGAEGHPPLNLLILKIWQLFSQNIFFIRSLSLIFGVLSILSIAIISKKLFDKKVGLLAAFLVTISPSLIYYSSIARMYSLAIFEFTLVIYYFIKFLNRKSVSFPLIVLFLIGLYTHFFFIILFLMLNLYFILFKQKIKNSFKNLIITDIIILVFFIPAIILILFSDRSFAVPLNIFQKFPFFYSTPIVPWDWITGFRIVVLKVWDTSSLLGILICFVSLILFFLCAYVSRKNHRIALFSFVFILTPVLMFIFSLIFSRLWAVRSFTIFSPLYFLVVSYALSKLKGFSKTFVLLLITSLVSAFLLLYYKTSLGPNNLTGQINANFEDNDAIIYNDVLYFLPTAISPPPGNHFLVHGGYLTLNNLKNLGVEITRFSQFPGNYPKIWYLKHPTNWPPYDEVADNWEDFLQKNFKEVERKKYLNFWLILYEK